ncbi:hypothetical protein ABIF07_003591 [Bradyrhizobium elkanii]|uniref:hypothetical protein n=1 Tax=Bradyrhizobium elkanii TaxID=29448 RepID=UPI00216A0DF9|nr:hypothetical protein [Bradyrhizobium elkanii]MCS3689383.1 hypothetical protein [Bradyrhizobium elkanii]
MKLLYSLLAAGALLAGVANAQTWPTPTTSGNFSVRKASITSASTITAAPVRDTLQPSFAGDAGRERSDYSDHHHGPEQR